jgi:hypothetical protein
MEDRFNFFTLSHRYRAGSLVLIVFDCVNWLDEEGIMKGLLMRRRCMVDYGPPQHHC